MRISRGEEHHPMDDSERLTALSEKLGYDLNRNLKYLALKDTLMKYGVRYLLNIGCGRGLLEYVLPEEICCKSIDIDRDALSIASSLNGEKRNRTFERMDLFQLPNVHPGRKYEAIVISEVLEHLQEDKRCLSIAKESLLPNGYLFLTVPNRNRFRNCVRRLFGRDIAFMVSDHLREYSLKEIMQKLKNVGFQVVDWEGIYWGFPKENRVRKFLPTDHPLRRFLVRSFRLYATYIFLIAKLKNANTYEVQKGGSILLATPSFPPAGGGRGIRWTQMIRHLSPKGWRFDVLTINPLLNQDRRASDQTLFPQTRIQRTSPGPFYSFRKNLLSPQSKSKDRNASSALMRFRSILKRGYRKFIHPILIPDEMVEWFPYAIKEGKEMMGEKRYFLLITSGFPFTSHLVGYFLKKRSGIYWIADYGDPWSIREDLHAPNWIKTFQRRLEAKLLKGMDAVIFTNEAVREAYSESFPFLPKSKLHVIGQGYDEELYRTREPIRSDRFQIVYTGILYNRSIRDHHPFLESLKSLRDLSFDLVVAGDISQEDEREFILQDSNISMKFLGSLPHSQVVSYQKGASILLLIENQSVLQIPGKIFEYLAARRPILCISDNPETVPSQFVRQYNRGFVTPNDPLKISEAIRELYHHWQNRNLDSLFHFNNISIEKFSWRSRSEQMEEVFKKILENEKS